MSGELRRRALDSKYIALESKKTTSRRKLQSKQNSAATSPASSRPGSAVASRNASRLGTRNNTDEEGGDDSDETEFSTVSMDHLLAEASPAGDAPATWEDELTNRVNFIIERNKRSLGEREQDLWFYVACLRRHFAENEISGRVDRLCKSFLRAAQSDVSQAEATTGLYALQVTALTDSSEDYFGICATQLKNLIQTSQSPETKTEAIHALGTVAYHGGSSEDGIQGTMDWLLDIVESDGHRIGAADDGGVVSAALNAWAFLATQIEDMQDQSQEAIEVISAQLESTDADVIVAAGEAIALLYEKSWTTIEDDEDIKDIEHTDPKLGRVLVKRYDPFDREDRLLEMLSNLTKLSSHRQSKKAKKTIHTSAADVQRTIEYPPRGPRYSTAREVDSVTGVEREYGSRMRVKVGKDASMQINKWWMLIRLNELKRVLGSGFMEHYERNELVGDTLPTIVS